jgi:GNAT superfamily N-acetyltransferase
MFIREAVPTEASLLTELAMRSKAVWGYSAEFMKRCRPALTVTDVYIALHPTFVAVVDDAVAGFYSLKPRDAALELDLLFVEPAWIGRGIGARLIAHAREQAIALGHERLLIESDPGAEGFYLRSGARRIGEVQSTVESGRLLPLLEMTLVPAQ